LKRHAARSLFALASAGGLSGVATAQSSIVLFGTLDVSAKVVKNDGSDRRLSLSQDGINPSQLGVRGVEDLGDGLKAGFTLVSTVMPDTGTAAGKFWNQGRVLGARLGWAAGSFDMALAGVQQRFDLASDPATTGIEAGSHQDTINLAGSYDFGTVKLLGYVDHDKRNALKETRGTISALMRFGLSEVHLGYSQSHLSNGLAGNTNNVSQIAATAQYNLSKRMAIYATAARLSNGDFPLSGVTQSVAGWNAVFAGSTQTAQPVPGGNSSGFELGIRHFF